MRQRRAKRIGPMALALILVLTVGATACGDSNKPDDQPKFKLAATCFVNQRPQELEPVSPDMADAVAQWPLGGCVRLWELAGETPYSKHQLTTTFPEIPSAEIDGFAEFSIVLCPGNAATAAKFPSSVGALSDVAAALEATMQQACGDHAGLALTDRPGWGSRAGLPGLPGLSLSTPSSSNRRCNSGVVNPYAQGDAGIVGIYNQPANRAKEDLTLEIGGWIGGGAGVGLILGEGSPAPIARGIGAGALGKFFDLLVNDEKAAAEVGQYMWDQAIWVANEAVKQANENAVAAGAAADKAEALAKQKPNDSALQQLARDTRSTANRAQASAENAQNAARRTQSAYKGAGQGVAEAKQAAEETAKARAEAERQLKEAEDKAKDKSPDPAGPTQGAPTNEKGPKTSDDIDGCGALRAFIWECERARWQSSACQEFLWKINGCKGDLAVIYPTADGYACAGQHPNVDPALVKEVAEVMCHQTINPEPGQDPCSAAVQSLSGGIRQRLPGECDPTRAFSEDGGCKVAPQVAIEVKEFCVPTPPYLPYLPCRDTDGPPLVPRATMQAGMKDAHVFINSAQGFGTPSSRDAQLMVDEGGGYNTVFIFYGFEVVGV
jgi:hypothetical protein